VSCLRSRIQPAAVDHHSSLLGWRLGGLRSDEGDPLVVELRDELELAAQRLDAASQRRHLLIAPRGRPGGVVDATLAAHGLTRRVAVRIKTFALAGPIVATSDLVATVPSVLAERFAQTLPLAVLPPPLPLPGFSLDLLWHERYHHDPAHAWFRAAVADTLGR